MGLRHVMCCGELPDHCMNMLTTGVLGLVMGGQRHSTHHSCYSGASPKQTLHSREHQIGLPFFFGHNTLHCSLWWTNILHVPNIFVWI